MGKGMSTLAGKGKRPSNVWKVFMQDHRTSRCGECRPDEKKGALKVFGNTCSKNKKKKKKKQTKKKKKRQKKKKKKTTRTQN